MSLNLQQEPWSTARKLLNGNNFVNASLKHWSSFKGFKIGVNTKNSWCDYQVNGTTTIYLKPEMYPNEVNKQIAVACHEVGHAINYELGKTNIKKLQFYTKASFFLFLPLWINAALGPWIWDWSNEGFIISIVLSLVMILIMNPYHTIYKNDEVNAWIKGKEIYQDLIDQNLASQNASNQQAILKYIDKRTLEAKGINGRWLTIVGMLIYPISFLFKTLYLLGLFG